MFKAIKEGGARVAMTPFKRFIDTVFIPICVFIISLGSFSEAFLLVEDLMERLRSKFSNEVEYETLEKIHVGNTIAYLEDLVGAPAATKSINDDLDVNYYFDDKYLLTGYFKADRVVAYLVVPLVEGFEPVLPWNNEMNIGEGEFTDYQANIEYYGFDEANTNRYFVELAEQGLSGFLQNAYLGSVQYGLGDINIDALGELYRAEVHGSEEDFFAVINGYRSSTMPNFYGEGELDLSLLQKGMLSNGEFLNFFGTAR